MKSRFTSLPPHKVGFGFGMEVALEIRSPPDNILLMFATEQNDVSAISGWHVLFEVVGTVVMR